MATLKPRVPSGFRSSWWRLREKFYGTALPWEIYAFEVSNEQLAPSASHHLPAALHITRPQALAAAIVGERSFTCATKNHSQNKQNNNHLDSKSNRDLRHFCERNQKDKGHCSFTEKRKQKGQNCRKKEAVLIKKVSIEGA